MKEIKSANYSIWIGDDSLSKLDLSQYSKVGILVDENTKRDCLKKLPKIPGVLIIEIESGEKNKNNMNEIRKINLKLVIVKIIL